MHTENQRPRCPGSGLKVCVARKADICFAQGGYMVVGKPNLVKDFCPRLPLDLDLDFVLGLGQAFQLHYIGGWIGIPKCQFFTFKNTDH